MTPACALQLPLASVRRERQANAHWPSLAATHTRTRLHVIGRVSCAIKQLWVWRWGNSWQQISSRVITSNLTLLSTHAVYAASQELVRLTNNNLVRIPACVGNLKNLRRLHLGKNKLSLLPKEICRLWQLQELLLSANMLQHLPEELGNLQGLVKLHVNDNSLRRIPESIGCLTELRSIQLHGNPGMVMPPRATAKGGIDAILQYLQARLCRVRWNIKNHTLLCKQGNLYLYTVLMCAEHQYASWRVRKTRRLPHVPPELWCMIFCFLKGGDMLVGMQTAARRPRGRGVRSVSIEYNTGASYRQ